MSNTFKCFKARVSFVFPTKTKEDNFPNEENFRSNVCEKII